MQRMLEFELSLLPKLLARPPGQVLEETEMTHNYFTMYTKDIFISIAFRHHTLILFIHPLRGKEKLTLYTICSSPTVSS